MQKEEELAILAAKWQLNLADNYSEEEVIAALARRVEVLLSDIEAFFQTMYRLDISEQKLQYALETDVPSISVARLVWERQWEKAVSRKTFFSPPPNDEELKW